MYVSRKTSRDQHLTNQRSGMTANYVLGEPFICVPREVYYVGMSFRRIDWSSMGHVTSDLRRLRAAWGLLNKDVYVCIKMVYVNLRIKQAPTDY